MIRLPGDTLLVSSLSPGLTWYTGDGEFIRQGPLPYERLGISCMSFEGGISLLPDGSLLVVYEGTTESAGCPLRPDGPYRLNGLVARVDRVTRRLDSLAVLPGTERDGGNWRVYGRDLLAVGGRDNIFVGESGGDSILVFGTDGSRVGCVPVPFEPQPVPASATTEPEVIARTRSGRTLRWQLHYPDTYPRFARLLVDTQGLLWVMAYPAVARPISSWVLAHPSVAWVPAGGGAWRVLDSQGQTRAELTTPDGVFPYEIGSDYLLGIKRDTMRVESVVLLRLRRSGR